MNENGKPVDWWFMYKVSGESQTSGDLKIQRNGIYLFRRE